MKKCTPDRIREYRGDDCKHFQFKYWTFRNGKDGTVGHCTKLNKTVVQFFGEEAPCEPTKQTTLV